MRIQTTIIGFLMLVQPGCTDDNIDIATFRDDASILTLNGTWKVSSFEDFTAMTTEYKTQENSWGKEITVTFDDTVDPHELSGTNISNTMLGEFDYVGERQFKINSLFTTEVAQPEWADKFIDSLIDPEGSFKINVQQLRIYYDKKSKSVTLNRADP